jgi:hypothetical protein
VLLDPGQPGIVPGLLSTDRRIGINNGMQRIKQASIVPCLPACGGSALRRRPPRGLLAGKQASIGLS